MNRSPRTAPQWVTLPAIASLLFPSCVSISDDDIDVSDFVEATSASDVTTNDVTLEDIQAATEDGEAESEEELVEDLIDLDQDWDKTSKGTAESDEKEAEEKKKSDEHAAVQSIIADPFLAEAEAEAESESEPESESEHRMLASLTGAELNKRAFFLDRDGHVAQAAELYAQACDAGTMKGCNNLGWLMERQGKRDEARAQYRKACASRHPGACDNLARAEVGPRRVHDVASKATPKLQPKGQVIKLSAQPDPSFVAAVLEKKLDDGTCVTGQMSYAQACEKGDRDACIKAARQAKSSGSPERAVEMYERALRLASAH